MNTTPDQQYESYGQQYGERVAVTIISRSNIFNGTYKFQHLNSEQ